MTDDPFFGTGASDVEWMSRHLDQLRKTYEAEHRSLILAIIDILDAVQRMEVQPEPASGTGNSKAGLRVLKDKIHKLLQDRSVEEVPTDGRVDPAVHHVVDISEEQGEPETIVRVVRPGYLWNDRLLRPADVVAVQRPEES